MKNIRSIIMLLTLINMSINSTWAQNTANSPCEKIQIFSKENDAGEFIKITPIAEKEAKFEACYYQDNKVCRNLGNHKSYKMTELTYKKYSQILKGGALVAFDLGASLALGFAVGGSFYVATGGIAYGTTLYSVLVVHNIAISNAIVGITTSLTGLALSSTKALNPMTAFRDAVAVGDIGNAYLNNTCNLSVELSESELIDRVESVLEKFEGKN